MNPRSLIAACTETVLTLAVVAGAGAVLRGSSSTPSDGQLRGSSSTLSNRRLADRLGNQNGIFATTSVTCAARTGKAPNGRRYNRWCNYSRYVGLCSPGTGEIRKMLYVRVRGATFRVVQRQRLGGFVRCASVA